MKYILYTFFPLEKGRVEFNKSSFSHHETLVYRSLYGSGRSSQYNVWHMPKYNPTIQKPNNKKIKNKKWLRSNAGTWLFLGGHLHPVITRTCGRVSLCYISTVRWGQTDHGELPPRPSAAALTRLEAAHSVKSMLACVPSTLSFFFFPFCPTGKLKTPRALSDFFFFFPSSSSSSFCFFVCVFFYFFLHDTYSTELLPHPRAW